jgi:hypothetical protein
MGWTGGTGGMGSAQERIRLTDRSLERKGREGR